MIWRPPNFNGLFNFSLGCYQYCFLYQMLWFDSKLLNSVACDATTTRKSQCNHCLQVSRCQHENLVTINLWNNILDKVHLCECQNPWSRILLRDCYTCTHSLTLSGENNFMFKLNQYAQSAMCWSNSFPLHNICKSNTKENGSQNSSWNPNPGPQYSWSKRQTHHKHDKYTAIAGRVWSHHNYLNTSKLTNAVFNLAQHAYL